MKLWIDDEENEHIQSLDTLVEVNLLSRNRLRAPSIDSLTPISDNKEPDCHYTDDELDQLVMSFASVMQNSNNKKELKRDALMRELERSCANRAIRAVNMSVSYQNLCEALQKTRAGYVDKLYHDSPDLSEHKFDSAIKKHILIENTRASELQQLHSREKAKWERIEQELIKAQEEEIARETKRQEDEKRRAAEQKRFDEMAVAKEKEKLELKEAQRAAEINKEKELAERENRIAQKRIEKEEKINEQKQVKQKPYHLVQAEARLAKLEELAKTSSVILTDTSAQVKSLRVRIKVEAGACNQISASPTTVELVTKKISDLLQNAKQTDPQLFDFALNLIASNLTKQSQIVTDIKSCYPIGHVITILCMRTPELTDIVLAHFHKICIFTIPNNPKMKSSQTRKEYKEALGFEKSVDESTKDPDGLEHVTSYTKRMTMIVAVLVATMQTTQYVNHQSTQPEGLSIRDCWAFLARLVNEPPHLMSGPLILTTLEVAGFELSRHFQKQFRKLVELISTEICSRLSHDTKTGAANSAGQLTIWLQTYVRSNGMLKEPDGRELIATELTEEDEDRVEGANGSGGSGGYATGSGRGRGRGQGRGRGSGRYY